MTLSKKNKKVLENSLNCKIRIYATGPYEDIYDLTFNDNIYESEVLWHNKKENFYELDAGYLNNIIKINELCILNININYIKFIIVDNLKNIDI